MLGPVIARCVKRIVDALPRGGLGLLEEDANVPPLVGGLQLSTEVVGDPGEQFVGAPSRARDVEDDRGERHQGRS